MKLYITYYEHGYRIHTVEESEIKLLGKPKLHTGEDLFTFYKPDIGHYGPIWHRHQIFTTEQAAYNYQHNDTIYKAMTYMYAGQASL